MYVILMLYCSYVFKIYEDGSQKANPVIYSHSELVSVSQAQESPEPVYDLSECGLKTVPGGTYARIKIMLKEGLLLQVRN